MENVRNVLVAIDLGESSKQAFAEARNLARQSGATLHLLCVVQDPSALPWAPAADDIVLSTLTDQMEQDARAHLAHLLSSTTERPLRAERVVRVGRRPSVEILDYAAAKNIDVLVVGRGDHGGPGAAAETGSVAEAVVRGASCPVLVVPARRAADRP